MQEKARKNDSDRSGKLNIPDDPGRRGVVGIAVHDTAWQVELAWWHVRLLGETVFRPNPAEVESIEWLSFEEMQNLPNLLPSNHEFLAAISKGKIRL